MQNKPIEGSTNSSSPWIVTPIGSFGWLLRQGDSWFQSFEYILGFLEPAWHVIVGQWRSFRIFWDGRRMATVLDSFHHFENKVMTLWDCNVSIRPLFHFKNNPFALAPVTTVPPTLRPRSQCLPSARDRWHRSVSTWNTKWWSKHLFRF